MDWRVLQPLTAEGLLGLAGLAVRETRGWVEAGAVSHVGFRSRNMSEWQDLLDAMAGKGVVCMTFKADGRRIPFVKLAQPLEVDGGSLEYVELPAPKSVQVDEPVVLVAYQGGENEPALIRDGFDVRVQKMHAKDFIERDIGRTM